MKTKFILGIILIICCIKMCNYEYANDIIAYMPQEIYRNISAENPGWNERKIADYYVENYDSLIEEWENEQWVTKIANQQ
jgi:hypothetical protein